VLVPVVDPIPDEVPPMLVLPNPELAPAVVPVLELPALAVVDPAVATAELPPISPEAELEADDPPVALTAETPVPVEVAPDTPREEGPPEEEDGEDAAAVVPPIGTHSPPSGELQA